MRIRYSKASPNGPLNIYVVCRPIPRNKRDRLKTVSGPHTNPTCKIMERVFLFVHSARTLPTDRGKDGEVMSIAEHLLYVTLAKSRIPLF